MKMFGLGSSGPGLSYAIGKMFAMCFRYLTSQGTDVKRKTVM